MEAEAVVWIPEAVAIQAVVEEDRVGPANKEIATNPVSSLMMLLMRKLMAEFWTWIRSEQKRSLQH